MILNTIALSCFTYGALLTYRQLSGRTLNPTGDTLNQTGTGYTLNQTGTGYTLNQTGTGYTLNQTGTGDTLNQTGTGDTLNQTGTGYTLNQTGTGYTINQTCFDAVSRNKGFKPDACNRFFMGDPPINFAYVFAHIIKGDPPIHISDQCNRTELANFACYGDLPTADNLTQTVCGIEIPIIKQFVIASQIKSYGSTIMEIFEVVRSNDIYDACTNEPVYQDVLSFYVGRCLGLCSKICDALAIACNVPPDNDSQNSFVGDFANLTDSDRAELKGHVISMCDEDLPPLIFLAPFYFKEPGSSEQGARRLAIQTRQYVISLYTGVIHIYNALDQKDHV